MIQTPGPVEPGSVAAYAKYLPSGEMTASFTAPVEGSRVTRIDSKARARFEAAEGSVSGLTESRWTT